jgi:hypothetical protein
MRTRLWTHVRSHDLDRALASGVSPDCSAALSLRAQTLIGSRARAALARSLRKLVDDAQHPLSRAASTCRSAGERYGARAAPFKSSQSAW